MSDERLSALYRFWTIVRRDIAGIVCNPVLLMTNTVAPLLLVVVLGYLTKDYYGAAEITAYDYYGITILIFTVLNVSITAANSFMEQSLKTSNLRVMYAPIPPSYIYLSKITATFLFTFCCNLGMLLLLDRALGVHLGGEHAIYLVAVILVFNLFSSSLGVFFCCLFKSEELANKILSMCNNVLALAGGLFFSLDSFGKTAETVSYFSPVKWVAEGLFRIVYDGDFSLFAPTIAVLFSGFVLLLIGCKRTFKVEDYV